MSKVIATGTLIASLFLTVACTTTRDYTICDTPNCGDPVDIEVVD